MRNIIEGLLIVSAQASIMVMAVLILRLFIKKTYKVFTYFMWLAILLRLCVPIQMESPFGIIETKEKIVVETPVDNPEYNYDVQDDLGIQNNTVTVAPEVKPEVKPSITPQAKPNTAPDTTPSVSESDKPEVTKTKLALTKEQIVLIVWLMGAMVVATLAAVQVIMLRRRVRFAIHVEGNIWETDNINTAFVIGIFRPRIYIPASLNKKERDHILMHERMHIRHGDNIVRVVMLLVNVFYWWNPLVWVAVHLMKKDMEMFCDESVIKKMDGATQGAYLRTLLNCSAKNSGIIPVMSFGETNTEVRIRHIMNLKRPKFYIFMTLIVFVLIGAVGCVSVARTNEKPTTLEKLTTDESVTNESEENIEKVDINVGNENDVNTTHSDWYGIYANKNIDDFILIDKNYLTFWDLSLFAGNIMNLDYYMGYIQDKYENYDYEIIDNKFCLFEADSENETILLELEIVNNKTIKYKGMEYSFYQNLGQAYCMNNTGYPQYDEILEKMVDIRLKYGNNGDAYVKEGLSSQWSFGYSFIRGGFYLTDLDGDGIDEMLLGENADGAWCGVVYEIYTIKDGKAIKLCEGAARDRYYLCAGNKVFNEGCGGASNSVHAAYVVDNGELIGEKYVLFDSYYDEENPWFLTDEKLDPKTGTSISREKAQEIIGSYKKLSIKFTPFATPEF